MPLAPNTAPGDAGLDIAWTRRKRIEVSVCAFAFIVLVVYLFPETTCDKVGVRVYTIALQTWVLALDLDLIAQRVQCARGEIGFRRLFGWKRVLLTSAHSIKPERGRLVVRGPAGERVLTITSSFSEHFDLIKRIALPEDESRPSPSAPTTGA